MKRVLASALKPAKKIAALRSDKKTINAFADEYGLVYFGFVSQRDDEHRIVRGMTLSTKHRDEHYCIGTYEDYDVVFVERSDELRTKHGIKKAHRWHILELDLRTKRALPHVFIGSHSHSEEFYMQMFTKFPTLRSVHLGHTVGYPPEFEANYRVYATPSKVVEIESLLPPDLIMVITRHFKGLAFEISETSLFIYSENVSLTLPLLEAMIKNGRWLAGSIDQTAFSLDKQLA